MSNLVKVVFGKDQVLKLEAGKQLTEEETKDFVKQYLFESEEEKQAFLMGLEASNGWQEYEILEHETELNSFTIIDSWSIRPNRTVEVIQLSNGEATKVLYVFNYQGTDYYVFNTLQHLMNHFDNIEVPYYHCSTEIQLDGYLATVDIL